MAFALLGETSQNGHKSLRCSVCSFTKLPGFKKLTRDRPKVEEIIVSDSALITRLLLIDPSVDKDEALRHMSEGNANTHDACIEGGHGKCMEIMEENTGRKEDSWET